MSIKCDVIVIGGGHAGVEAALMCARQGCDTYLLTAYPNAVSRMPCNPSIGGPAKAHLVREIDALGGEMARAIDDTHIHIRNLNTGKGPAVQALRAQADRPIYSRRLHQAIFSQSSLTVVAEEALGLIIEEQKVKGAITETGKYIYAGATIICTGTFLQAVLHLGDVTVPGGRSGERPAKTLSKSLLKLGLRLGRLKTGTCPRINRKSIDTRGLDVLKPSSQGLVFSDLSQPDPHRKQVDCYITRTTPLTRSVIMNNLHRSPLYGGAGGGITGIGPRYCPSLEDKFVRFPEREFHLVFLEPEGFNVPEIYLQGVSTSMPLDIQVGMVRSLPGLEKAEIVRPGYAVEYDYVDPTQLRPSLQVQNHPELFLAGQINGTSGYEEAAAQGVLAGINAFLYLNGQEPLVLRRDQAYLGVLIDDLVCRGTKEPYRMHTSRAEFRLLLREDNADDRLTTVGHELGIIEGERWNLYQERALAVKKELERLSSIHVNAALAEKLSESLKLQVSSGITLSELVKRPNVDLNTVRASQDLPALPLSVTNKVEVTLKYEGYIIRQQREVAKQQKLDLLRIPANTVYAELPGLSREAVEKLNRTQPLNIGQASRIPGISPADITALLIYMKKRLHND